MASVTLYEDEIRRGNTFAEAAALERSRLSEELAMSKSVSEESPARVNATGLTFGVSGFNGLQKSHQLACSVLILKVFSSKQMTDGLK